MEILVVVEEFNTSAILCFVSVLSLSPLFALRKKNHKRTKKENARDNFIETVLPMHVKQRQLLEK